MAKNTGAERSVGTVGGASSFETLEPRLLLSGNVVAYAAAGDLYVVGDADSNDIVVTVQGSGSFRVATGTTSATTINGGSDPVDFADVTGNVNVFLGAGNDLLTFTLTMLTPVPGTGVGDVIPPNIYGNLFVDMGPGDNSFSIGSGGEIIAGNMTVVAGPGANVVQGESFQVAGAVTVLNGWGAATTRFTSCQFGSLFIQNAGGALIPTGLGNIPGGASTDTELSNVYVNGDITLLDGVGDDYIILDVTAHNTTINSGPDGLAVSVHDSRFGGSLLIYKGDGGAVQAPGSAPGADDQDNHEAAGYMQIEDTTISGSLVCHGAAGLDEVSLSNVTVGESVIGVGLPDASGGSLFIDTEQDASFIYMDDMTVNGPTLIKQRGGADTYTIQNADTTTTLDVGVSLQTTGIVGNGASNQFYGDFTVINVLGTDVVALGDAHFWGNVAVFNGPGSAAFGVFRSFFEGALTWVRGDGGTLPSVPDFLRPLNGASAGPLGYVLHDTTSYVTFRTADVAGPFVLINGVGDNLTEIAGLTLAGDLLAVNGWGYAEVLIESSTLSGNATVINVGGPIAVPEGVGTSTVYLTAVTLIGAPPQGVDGLAGTTPDTTLTGNLTVIGGAGVDGVLLNAADIGGDVFISNGPDGAILSMEHSVVSGDLTALRGDGELTVYTSASLGGISGSDWMVMDSEIDGNALFIGGAGADQQQFSSATFGGDVTVLNGLGAQSFTASNSTFNGSVSILAPAADSSEISIDPPNPTPATIHGNLWILGGPGVDNVILRGVAVTGTTTIDTSLGADTIAIDDSAFTGAVALATGPDYGSGDADTVNIERATGTSAGTTFASTLVVKTGVGDDTVNIGLAGTSNVGLGNEANGCFAHFAADVSVDGGAGADTLDYLTAGNVFVGDAVLTNVNVETVV